MKRIQVFSLTLTLSLFAISVFGHNYPAPTDIVKAYFAAADRGNSSEVEKLLANDCLVTTPFVPQGASKEAWLGILQGFKTGFPDMKHEIADCLESGFKVAVRGNFTGKNDGPMMGNPATGNQVNVPFNTILELDKSWKIASVYVQFDQKAFETQLLAGMPNPAVRAELNVRAMLAATDAGDVDLFMSYCTANTMHHFQGAVYMGEDLKKRILAFKAGFPDIQRTVENCVVSGNTVVVRGWVSGTHQGPFAGRAATGKSVKVSFIAIYQLDAAGKVEAGWVEYDRLTVEKQLNGEMTAFRK